MALSPLVLVAASLWAWGYPPIAVPASIFPPDPTLTPPPAKPAGSLDKEVIRRVIRGHISEVQTCYENELATKPTLAGRVMVQFTIGASGQVISSVLQSSTIANVALENCIVQAVGRWEFPKPIGGGIVIVSYPFVLNPTPVPSAPATTQSMPRAPSPSTR